MVLENLKNILNIYKRLLHISKFNLQKENKLIKWECIKITFLKLTNIFRELLDFK